MLCAMFNFKFYCFFLFIYHICYPFLPSPIISSFSTLFVFPWSAFSPVALLILWNAFISVALLLFGGAFISVALLFTCPFQFRLLLQLLLLLFTFFLLFLLIPSENLSCLGVKLLSSLSDLL